MSLPEAAVIASIMLIFSFLWYDTYRVWQRANERLRESQMRAAILTPENTREKGKTVSTENTEKPVTYEDRADLDALRSMVEDFDSDTTDRQIALLDRLIAIADADAPPLPEGWVVRAGKFAENVFWSYGDGTVSAYRGAGGIYSIGAWPGCTWTPLRLTITEADVDKAADRLWRGDIIPGGITRAREVVYMALEAAGIEVAP